MELLDRVSLAAAVRGSTKPICFLLARKDFEARPVLIERTMSFNQELWTLDSNRLSLHNVWEFAL